ncbi:MAG TPA: isochorismatase family cysteine hydrolase [Planctomycetota bacterium]|nr:isochorismatase family cysteine hydrolase [Planctomycetota bacterium]
MPGPKTFSETYVTAETLDAECAKWMDETAPYRWREVEPVEPDAIALVVVDMTRPFIDAGRPLATPNARAILPRVRELADAFRAARRPVLWIVQGHHSVAHDRGKRLNAWWPTPILEGTDDVTLADGLDVAPGEKVIVKRRYSGFYGTDLELTLRNLDVTQVVIAGILSHVCPFATAFDAFERDLCVYYPADATASMNRELHLAALRIVAGWCGYVVRTSEITAGLAR